MQPKKDITLSKPIDRRYNVIGVHRDDTVTLRFNLSDHPEWQSLGYWLSVYNEDDQTLIATALIEGSMQDVEILSYDKNDVNAVCVVEDKYGSGSADRIETIGYIIFRQFDGGVNKSQGGTVPYTDSDGSILSVPYYATSKLPAGALPDDVIEPIPVISSSASDPTSLNPIPMTVSWNKDVQGFTDSDILVDNGEVNNFTIVDSSSYTFDIIPDSNGLVQVNIPQGSASDSSGNSSEAATQFTISYDGVRPSVSISSSAGSTVTTTPITATILFSESVSGFDIADLVLGNCTADNFTQVNGNEYEVDLHPQADGSFTLDVPSGVASDPAGNTNTAAIQFIRIYDASQPQPTLSTSEPSPTNTTPVVVNIDTGEPTTDFAAGDLVVSNTTLQNFTNTGDDQNYTVEAVPSGDGSVTIDIPAGSYTDSSGNSNTAATQFSFIYDATAPSVSSATLTPQNETDTTADITFTKATDATSPDTQLIYRLYRSLHDDEFPDDSDLSTLSNIDTNGTEIASGTDVSTLSESNAIAGNEYRYNITVEDLAGNRSLYNQILISYITPIVTDVSINESFTYQDISDGQVQLSSEITAENVDDLSVNWISQNTEVATIDANGLVTFVTTGQVTIRAESNFDPTEFDEITFTIWEFSAVSEEYEFTTIA